MTEPQLNEKVQQLIKKAEALQPNGIEIQYHDEKSGLCVTTRRSTFYATEN